MRKLNILIAENDTDGRTLIQASFDGSGLFNVMAVAEDGKALQDIMENGEIFYPDAILAAAEPGYDVLYYIKSSDAFREIPVVTYSVSVKDGHAEKCEQMGTLKHFVPAGNAGGYDQFAKELYDLLSGD
jgi:CheY-like chemotaxis protein